MASDEKGDETSTLNLCRCGLAQHMVDVDGPSGEFVAYICEHCDVPCDEQRCRLCTTLSRAQEKRA